MLTARRDPGAPPDADAPPRPSARPADRVRRACSLLVAAVAAGIAGCGSDAPGSGASAMGPDPESYPLRTVFVATKAGGDPKAKEIRTRAEALARAREAKRRLETPGTSFGTVAKEMSDDVLTADEDGFAGFVAPWTHEVPEIVGTAAALPVGGVSDPVETPVGFHVLQRLSRAEGKEEESKHAAAVSGFIVQWHDVVPTLPVTQTKDQAYAEAAQAVTELRAGTIVGSDAQARILGAIAFNAGLRRRNTLGFEALGAAALALPVDAWSDPVETPKGWAVVRRRPYLRAYVRHILVAHRASAKPVAPVDRMPPEAHQRAAEALAKVLKDPSLWDRVVEEYSDEPSSKAHHGFMGEAVSTESVGRRMADEFLDAIEAIPPGEIGKQVVESRYGFHVLWRRD